MQLATIAAPSSVAPTATPTALPTAVPAVRLTGGIDFEGTGRFLRFSAHATDHVYGSATGYESLQQAIDAVTFLTVGAREAAAGIFEHDGRFHARRLDNTVTFASGTTWKGAWRLEQFPADRELLDGAAPGTTTRAEALRAVVDGAQRIDVTHLPVRARPATR